MSDHSSNNSGSQNANRRFKESDLKKLTWAPKDDSVPVRVAEPCQSPVGTGSVQEDSPEVAGPDAPEVNHHTLLTGEGRNRPRFPKRGMNIENESDLAQYIAESGQFSTSPQDGPIAASSNKGKGAASTLGSFVTPPTEQTRAGSSDCEGDAAGA